MVRASISFVIIILITASLSGIRYRLVQHRTTREGEAREIPVWLNSMIEFLGYPAVIWNFVSMIGILLFSFRLCLDSYYSMIFIVPMAFLVSVGSVLMTFVIYKCVGWVTSRIFSKKILEQYHQYTVPEC